MIFPPSVDGTLKYNHKVVIIYNAGISFITLLTANPLPSQEWAKCPVVYTHSIPDNGAHHALTRLPRF